MFIDRAKIKVKAGNGGNGVVAWRREKFEPSGGPAGGDGGNGGSVIFITDEGIHTLMDFRYKTNYKAPAGEDGRAKRQYGKAGEHLYIKVPVGTLVKDAETGGVIADLSEKNQEFVIARGGRGGRGNAKFATPTRQAPGFAENGTKGQEREVVLELKLIADVGLVGFPNVGKSTLLSVMSNARPKIANYHFTTLSPNLGVVRVAEEKSFVMADIPGLIEGAAEGVGLGHDFLRHIERTRVLLHVLDISCSEGRDPIDDFKKINSELAQYNIRLEEKPMLIFANKTDIVFDAEKKDAAVAELRAMGYKVIEGSAAARESINELMYALWDVLEQTPVDYETYDEAYVEQQIEENEFDVRCEDGVYIVDGAYIEDLLARIYFDDRDSVRFFQEKLRMLGVVDRLVELGIDEGETVVICGCEFEFFS